MKRCKECGEPKDRSEFHKQAGSADGLQAKCKVCRRAASAVYRSTRKAEIQQRNAAYYYANREKISERDKRRNALPHRRAAHALASRRYREANRLKLQAQKMGHKELLDGVLVKLKVYSRCPETAVPNESPSGTDRGPFLRASARPRWRETTRNSAVLIHLRRYFVSCLLANHGDQN